MPPRTAGLSSRRRLCVHRRKGVLRGSCQSRRNKKHACEQSDSMRTKRAQFQLHSSVRMNETTTQRRQRGQVTSGTPEKFVFWQHSAPLGRSDSGRLLPQQANRARRLPIDRSGGRPLACRGAGGVRRRRRGRRGGFIICHKGGRSRAAARDAPWRVLVAAGWGRFLPHHHVAATTAAASSRQALTPLQSGKQQALSSAPHNGKQARRRRRRAPAAGQRRLPPHHACCITFINAKCVMLTARESAPRRRSTMHAFHRHGAHRHRMRPTRCCCWYLFSDDVLPNRPLLAADADGISVTGPCIACIWQGAPLVTRR